MAVNNLKEFHKTNLIDNKDHYTLFARYSHGIALNYV